MKYWVDKHTTLSDKNDSKDTDMGKCVYWGGVGEYSGEYPAQLYA